MIDVRGKRVLVIGLARSGRAVALCLRRHGAVVTVTDLRPPSAFQDALPELLAQKIGLELGSQRAETFLRSDLVVASPGVPWDLPQLQAARERNIPIVPEVEAASWFLEGTVVGITGSNGKTTTATLLGRILEASGFPTFVGGNIGVPLSSAVDHVVPGTILVTELSSFQLEAIQDFRPHVAVFLNLSPNHLDRHPSFESYAQAKRQIFRNQRANDYAILNADDPAVSSLASALAGRRLFFSRRQRLASGVFLSNGHIVYRVGHLERIVLEKREVQLRGEFNLENLLAAAAAGCVLGADLEALRNAVREFRGVEHRLEYVRQISGVEFYNNSKATSVDATVKSLEAFDRGIHLILGGKDKGAPYAPLRPLVKERVRDVLLIGSAAERIAGELAGAAELIHAGDMVTAVREAFRRAESGDVVLLAPACSSFDQFQDFEHRGRVFKDMVHRLAQEVEAGAVEWRKKQTAVHSVGAHGHAPLQAPTGGSAPGSTCPGAETSVSVIEGMAESEQRQGEPTPEQRPAEAERAAPAKLPALAPQGPLSPVPLSEPPQVKEPTVTEAELRTAASPPAEAPEIPPAASEDAAASGEESRTESGATEAPLDVPSDGPRKVGGGIHPRHPSRPLELVYVYEIGAEELPPEEIESGSRFLEDFPPPTPKSFRTPEVVQDELLPFEARATTSAAPREVLRLSPTEARSADDASTPQALATGRSERERRPSSSVPSRQPRLPGME